MSKIILLAIFALIAALAIFASRSEVQASQPQTSELEALCKACHSQANMTFKLGNEEFDVSVTPAMLASSVHGNLGCTDCHHSMPNFPHPPPSASSLREYRISQKDLCAGCHPQQYVSEDGGAHQSTQGDAPICTDCHSAHEVQKTSTASFHLESVSQCSQCHQNESLMEKYGVATNVVQTYLQDFHGKTQSLISLQGGNNQVSVAVCIDCHGIHNIQKPDSATSMVSKENLPQTCAGCHEGATANFPSAFLSHSQPTVNKAPLVFLARWFYRIMIPFVLVGLAIHVLIDLRVARRKEA